MLVLAIDSTMNGCSAGVYSAEHGLLSSESYEMNRGQAEHLMPMIGRVLGQAGAVYADVGLIAVTNGPGAFTGMRIGLSTAKALSMAMGVPAVGVSTFQAVLQSALDGVRDPVGRYAVLLETKRQDFYFQIFDRQSNGQVKPLSDGKSIPLGDIFLMLGDKKYILVGDALERFKSEVQVDINHLSFVDVQLPSVKSIACLALNAYGLSKIQENLKPVYIRPPDVGMTKNPTRTLDLDIFSG